MKQHSPLISVRLSQEQFDALRKATDKERDPYAPTITSVVARGIALALAEMQKRRGK
jgi:hypothetical protein